MLSSGALKSILILLFLSSSSFAIDYSYEEGKQIYITTCLSCHGEKGETNPKMQLVVKPRKLNKTILTPEQSFEVIKEGAHHWGARSDIMPSFKSVYDDDQIQDVVHYISKEFNSNRDERVNNLMDVSTPVSSEQKSKMLQVGEKIFKRNCSMCHGTTGNGESEYVEQSKANETFIYPYNLTRTLLTEDEIFLYSKFGGKFWGTAEDHMPSWKKKYNDFKLKSVAKYVNEQIKKIK